MNIILIVASIVFLFLSYMVLSLFTVHLDISKSFFILVTTWHFWCVLACIFVATGLIDLGLWRWKNFQDQRIIGNHMFVSDRGRGKKASPNHSRIVVPQRPLQVTVGIRGTRTRTIRKFLRGREGGVR